MAQKTLDQWSEELQELSEVASAYVTLPAGPGRDKLHVLYFALEKMIAECERNATNRAAVKRSKARRAAGAPVGQVPLWGDR